MAYLGGLTGGRRPLTYSLMPGQMRNTRVNVFQNNYIMPMDTCCYPPPPDCHHHDSGMPNLLKWLFGIGAGFSLAGGIIEGVSGKPEGAGGASKKDIDAENDLAQLQANFKKAGYTISKYSDGTCEARDKNGKLVASAKTPMLLRAELDKLQDTEKPADPKPPITPTQTAAPKLSPSDADIMITGFKARNPEYKDLDITYNNGKYIYNGQEFESLDKLKAELINNPPTAENTDSPEQVVPNPSVSARQTSTVTKSKTNQNTDKYTPVNSGQTTQITQTRSYDENKADETGMKKMKEKYPDAVIEFDKYKNIYTAKIIDKNGPVYRQVEAKNLEELETKMKEQKPYQLPDEILHPFKFK